MRLAIREKKKKVSATQKLCGSTKDTPVRLISWSKPIRDSEGRTPPLIGRGPDIPVCVRLKMRVLLQSEREVSRRDAGSSFSESDLFSECLTVPPGFCDR